MALSDMLKQAMSSAAYAAGYGVGKVSKALQDAAADPATQSALSSVKDAALKTADAADALADKMGPTLRSFANKAAPVLHDAAEKAVAAVKDAAAAAEPAVREGAARAQEAAVHMGAEAKDAARRAGSAAESAVHTAAEQVASQNAAGMREADARPHAATNARTGQKVVVEAYVKRPDGSRDYDAVYPQGTKSDFGPVGNKLVGMLLVLAGIPMLVLPGPGMAAIAAGMYFLTKGGASGASASRSGAGRPNGESGWTYPGASV